MPYRCLNCGHVFEEFKEVHTTYEAYNGVADLFGSSHPLTLYVCPNCNDEDIDEVEEEDDEDGC